MKTEAKLSLDTNILYHLANLPTPPPPSSFLPLAKVAGFALLATPTVMAELAYNARHGASLAGKALAMMEDWCIRELPELSDLEDQKVEAFSRALRKLGYIPDSERNDGRIIAETAVAGIPVLVSADAHLADIPRNVLVFKLHEFGLPPVLIQGRAAMLRYWRN